MEKIPVDESFHTTMANKIQKGNHIHNTIQYSQKVDLTQNGQPMKTSIIWYSHTKECYMAKNNHKYCKREQK